MHQNYCIISSLSAILSFLLSKRRLTRDKIDVLSNSTMSRHFVHSYSQSLSFINFLECFFIAFNRNFFSILRIFFLKLFFQEFFFLEFSSQELSSLVLSSPELSSLELFSLEFSSLELYFPRELSGLFLIKPPSTWLLL